LQTYCRTKFWGTRDDLSEGFLLVVGLFGTVYVEVFHRAINLDGLGIG
jgi:hypothetical protein